MLLGEASLESLFNPIGFTEVIVGGSLANSALDFGGITRSDAVHGRSIIVPVHIFFSIKIFRERSVVNPCKCS